MVTNKKIETKVIVYKKDVNVNETKVNVTNKKNIETKVIVYKKMQT